jgi:porphobilinogen deaminase
VVNFRGNVQTRLKKIENGQYTVFNAANKLVWPLFPSFSITVIYYTPCYRNASFNMLSMCVFTLVEVVDATLLALAGLKRLGMNDVIAHSQTIGWDEMLPAVAQVGYKEIELLVV